MNKTQANFDAYDGRLIALADLLEQLKKELDSTKKLKKTVNAIIAIMTKDQANALATTSNVPQLCLSCGRGNAKFIPPVHHIQGTDGKFYRAEVSRGANIYHNVMFEGYDIGQEVFNQPQPHNRHAHSSMGQVSLTGKNIFQPNYVGDKQGSTMLGMTGSGMMGTGGLKRGMRGQKKKFRPTSAKIS